MPFDTPYVALLGVGLCSLGAAVHFYKTKQTNYFKVYVGQVYALLLNQLNTVVCYHPRHEICIDAGCLLLYLAHHGQWTGAGHGTSQGEHDQGA